MTILTTIALIGSLFALALGVATVLGEQGYRFELRRRLRGRRRDGDRVGGRRDGDWATHGRS